MIARLGLVLIGAGLLSGVAVAQPPQRQRPPQITSPVVHDDGRVTFALYAPEAESFSVAGSDFPNDPSNPPPAAEQDDRGVWSVTLGPYPAGSYRYQFRVDGISFVDPNNTAISPSNSTVHSLVHLPGSEFSDLQDVPHGAVAEVQYFSKSLQRFRRCHVYTPPGYDQSRDDFPVLYLLHGASDCDASWSTVGRAGLVLDNLIAAGKAQPMIVVMPMGHTGPFSFGGGGNNFAEQMRQFKTDFESDLQPFVEGRYRISDQRSHRAIAGLSMGGAQTLDVAFADLDQFAYIGVFSSGIFGIDRPQADSENAPPSWEEEHRTTLDDKSLKDGLELVWFATGKDDFLLGTSRATVAMLKSHDFDVEFQETAGGHTWINWREHYLPEFVQRLFQESR